MIFDDHDRFKDPGCTCELEQAFGVTDKGLVQDDMYTVYDAECVDICHSKNKDYADLVCWALNRLDSFRHEACRVHDEKYWAERMKELDDE